MKRRTNYAGVIALLVIGAVGVYGIGLYVRKTPEAQTVPPEVRISAQPPHGESSVPASQKTSATVLTPRSHGGDLSFERSTETVPEGTDPIVFAVNRYLENSHIAPANAKAISVEVKEGVAYIDCTEAMEHTYGSLDEETLLKGLGTTLGQFPNVQKFQFLISGKPIETFGNVDLTQPQDVIRGNEASPPTGSTPPGA